ncbi:aminodeoxychorismate synthase component I [Pseudovibrio exalbescens]|uniref:aminodeoxychorismate synthase component I n=1 Tax=Pseudovibrio exalbescens TaxID=197461 RepID=UPI002365FDB1|nr:aminodeoxychorismate synthase component I [Pseudovibrio exalbescens]MDD7909935.1 aminodeoxychorismate synthase component I [Pseudovibrio exalbescens]
MSRFEDGTVLLLDRKSRFEARLLSKPLDVIECWSLDDVRATLAALEEARKNGAYLAGYFSYEFGFAFEEKLIPRFRGTGGMPLSWFGIYEAPEHLTATQVRSWLHQARDPSETSAKIDLKEFDLSRDAYDAAFQKTQQHLAEGDIYQINLTMRAALQFEGDPVHLFERLLFQQPVDYAALMHMNGHRVLSISPELFLSRRGDLLTCKPMKGTAARGRTRAEDQRIARWLASDTKSRAENTMILDLMRNDLSRIAEPGSVAVPSHCEVETYRSIFQMTSTTTAKLEPGAELPEIMERLFPCGSITGAPKLRAMEIIDDLEASPRGIYTGSIGAIEPNGDFCFNVAIRTLVLDEAGNGSLGTGSGVVFDSGASPEYEECLLKLEVFTDPIEPFGLIETMKWTPEDGFFLLERHMARLLESASYFGFKIDGEAVRAALAAHANAWDPSAQRVRLELHEDGSFQIENTPLPSASDSAWSVCLAREPLLSNNRFLFHKTTHRAFYDDARKRYQERFDCQETIFTNEDGFLTEGSFTTLFIRNPGKLLTPHLRHGLLPGTLRAGLLERGIAEEADLRPEDLVKAEAVYVGNSVRGLVKVELSKLFAAFEGEREHQP